MISCNHSLASIQGYTLRQALGFVREGLLRKNQEAYNESIVQRVAFHADREQFSEYLAALEETQHGD